MARIINLIDDEEYAIAQAAEALLDGGIIIFPTDTVYGVMARANAAEGLARLNRVKGRDEDKPVAALAEAKPPLVSLMRSWAGEVSEKPEMLVPGPLTVIAPAAMWGDALQAELCALPYPAIGVRIPRQSALQGLLRSCGGWLMASSANWEGVPTPMSLEGVLAQLEGEEITLAVDGGECADEASGIVSVSAGGISVVRWHPLLTG
jgi:L-threonylcarbamoyladenylate synthase